MPASTTVANGEAPPPGWIRVASRSRPNEFCLENITTGERIGTTSLRGTQIPPPAATATAAAAAAPPPLPAKTGLTVVEDDVQRALSGGAPVILARSEGLSTPAPSAERRIRVDEQIQRDQLKAARVRRRSFVAMDNRDSAAARKAAHKAKIAARKLANQQNGQNQEVSVTKEAKDEVGTDGNGRSHAEKSDNKDALGNGAKANKSNGFGMMCDKYFCCLFVSC